MTNAIQNSAMELNLTRDPEIVTLQPSIYAYLEKTGPFQKSAPLAWQEFKSLSLNAIAKDNIEAGAGLSRIDHTKQGDAAFIYQAGMFLKSKPATLPERLKLRTLEKGKYASFLLTGSYAQLPHVYPAAFEIMGNAGLSIRQGFCIEKYLNDYAVTPENELKTEILVPIA